MLNHFRKYFVMYEAGVKAAIGLSGSAKDLFLWMSLRVDLQNQIPMHARTRKQFADYLISAGLKPYSQKTLTKATKELVDAGILRRIQLGMYQLNPQYAWSSGVKERLDMIKKLKKDKKDDKV